MTIGSNSFDRFSPHRYGWTGTKGLVTWNGVDSPKVDARPKRITYQTTRLVRKRNGETKVVKYTFKVRSPNSPHKRNGPRPDNPYTKSYGREVSGVVPISGPNGEFYIGNEITGSQLSGDGGGVQSLFTANDINEQINKLMSKVKGSDFNLATFLGEANQSLSMIGDSAVRIAKSLYYIRRGDVSGGIRSLIEGTSRAPLQKRRHSNNVLYPNLRSDAGAQANLFLEFKYGWAPLLSDTQAASEMLAHHLELPKVKVVRTKKVKRKTTVTNGNLYNRVQNTVERVHERSIKASFTESQLPSLAAMTGILDPELVAWELTPFSFVIDWFLPIGAALEARATSKRLVGKFVISDKREATRKCKGLGYPWPSSIASSSYRMEFSRTISSTLTSEMPTVKPLNEALSVSHVVSAIALLTQVVTKPKFDHGPNIQRSSNTNREVQLLL